MASHVFVVDSSARRHQIKTTPGKYLRDILQEACQKFNKDPDQFGLSDSGRPPKAFDLSLTVRLAGLVNGAKLQLVQSSRSPAVLPIAVQLPESLGGGRVSDRFPSNTSLWLVLRKFEDAVAGDPPKKLNITQRGVPSAESGSGRLVYEQPVINVMGRELGTFTELQRTLLQLGFNSGNVLLRLNFKNSGTPMEEAMKEITDYFLASTPAVAPSVEKSGPMEGVEETAAARGAHAAAIGSMSSVPDPGANANDASAPLEGEASQDPSGDTIMTPPPPSPKAERPFEDDAVIASSSEGPLPSSTTPASTTEQPASPPAPSEPTISVYKPSSSTVPSAALAPHNPADFEPSVEHAQSHQATLARASQNRRLQSDAEIATSQKERQQALESIKTATIRIRFPDHHLIDLTISATDTAASLHDTVRDLLENPSEPFQLRHTGARGQPVTLEHSGDKKLIKDMGISGRVLVTMVWDSGASMEARDGPVLKASMREQAKELKVQLPDTSTEGEKTKSEGKKVETLSEKKERTKGDVEARMKKFLGFGKK